VQATLQQCTLPGRIIFQWLQLKSDDATTCWVDQHTVFNSKFYLSLCNSFASSEDGDPCSKFDTSGMSPQEIESLSQAFLVYFDDTKQSGKKFQIYTKQDNFLGVFKLDQEPKKNSTLTNFFQNFKLGSKQQTQGDKSDPFLNQVLLKKKIGKETCVQRINFIREEQADQKYTVKKHSDDSCSYDHYISMKGDEKVLKEVKGLTFTNQSLRAYVMMFIALPLLFFKRQRLEEKNHFFDGQSCYLCAYLANFLIENILRLYGIMYGKSNVLLVIYLPMLIGFLAGFKLRSNRVRNFFLSKFCLKNF
jgi:hypothetical protein